MTFSSILFCFIFLPMSIVLYYLIPKKYRNIYLLIISLIFYSVSGIKNLLILLFVIIYNYYAALKLESLKDKKRKYKLIEIIIINVFLLLYFKYYFSFLNVILPNNKFKTFMFPLGLSFYIFTLLSYIIDIYKKNIHAEKNFINFSLYIAFFPKLVMGPIMRYKDFRKQLPRTGFNGSLFNNGFKRFTIGLGMKVILADTISKIISSYEVSSMIGMIVIMVLTSLLIYYDFAGYTNMAIGIANVFGFNLPENFNYPYMSQNVSEFWRRWHITLGNWFKDYIYIPLGGSKKGRKILARNIMVVWLLTGIWHGSSFNFILWGLYFGILILIDKFVFSKIKMPKPLGIILTFILVSFGWVIFFNNDLSIMFKNISYLFNFKKFIDPNIINLLRNNFIYIIMGLLLSTPIMKKIGDKIKEKNLLIYNLGWNFMVVIILLLSTSFLVNNSYQPFLYFKF